MFKWKKLGKVFDPTIYDSKSWMYQYAQSPSTVIFRDFIRVYFCTRSQPDESKQYISRISYIDLDKNNLSNIINIAKRPVLELGRLGTFDEFGTYPVSCLKNNEDIICFYGGWTRCKSVPFDVSLGMAISKDGGNSFKKVGLVPTSPFAMSIALIGKKKKSLPSTFETVNVSFRVKPLSPTTDTRIASPLTYPWLALVPFASPFVISKAVVN